MLVSVIIPTSNGAKTIGKVLESIISQDYEDIEIIVIDNGSTDNTKEVVQQFIGKTNRVIRYYEYPIRLGHAGAINEGIRHARGDVIMIIHDDVVLCQRNWISTMLKTLLSNRDVGVVSSLFITDPDKLHGINKAFAYIYILGWHKPVNNMEVQEVMFTGLNNDVIKREVIEKVGLMDETYKYGTHDLDFSERVRRSGYKIILNPKVCAEHILSSFQRQLKSHLIKAWQYGFPSGIILRRYGYLPTMDNMYLAISLILFGLSFINPMVALIASLILIALSFIIEPPNYYRKPKIAIWGRKILVNMVGAVIFFILFKGNYYIIPLLGGVPLVRALLASYSSYKEQRSLKTTLLVLVLHPIWSLFNGIATLIGAIWFPIKLKTSKGIHQR